MPIKMTRFLASTIVATGLLFGCGLSAAAPKVDVSKLPPPAKQEGVLYEKDIKPIFEKSCVKCHSGAGQKDRSDMNNRGKVIKGGREGKAVLPGKSAESLIVHNVADLIRDFEMPPLDEREEFPALTRDQIALLRAWIDQGAK
jgi:mono/diheme cytochrome c family protein